jgi:hypothetical protein
MLHSTIAVLLLCLTLTAQSCDSGPPTLVGRWVNDRREAIEFGADGRLDQGAHGMTYKVIGPSQFIVTFDGHEIKCNYALGRNTLVMTFTEVDGNFRIPSELQRFQNMQFRRY